MERQGGDSKGSTLERVLADLTLYEQQSLLFLLGHDRQPSTNLLIEALAISGNLNALRKVFGYSLERLEEVKKALRPNNPHFSCAVHLLRKKLYMVAEGLEPENSRIVARGFAEHDDNPTPQLELLWDTLIKNQVLTLQNTEVLKEILLNLQKNHLFQILQFQPVSSNQFYKLNLLNPGFCLIINQKMYKTGGEYNSRPGTDIDRDRLLEAFTMYGYEVMIKENIKMSQMSDELKEASSCVTSEHSSLVICILAHGQQDQIICTDGQEYPIDKIKEAFNVKNCRALKGKPKMFFIQACQGDNTLEADGKTPLTRKEEKAEVDLAPGSARPPGILKENFQDYFVYLSAVAGTTSIRHKLRGTIFINALCSSLHALSPSTELNKVYNSSQQMIEQSVFMIEGKECGQVSELRKTMSRDVRLEAQPEQMREAIRMRFERCLVDLYVKRVIAVAVAERLRRPGAAPEQ